MPRGVRLNPEHDKRTKAKIQTSQIINRLSSFINGEIELSAAQVTAALGLLKKTMPDLSSVDATVDGEVTNYVLSATPMSADDWEATYGVEPSAGSTESTH